MHINRYTQPQTLTISNNFKSQLPHPAKQLAQPEAYHLYRKHGDSLPRNNQSKVAGIWPGIWRLTRRGTVCFSGSLLAVMVSYRLFFIIVFIEITYLPRRNGRRTITLNSHIIHADAMWLGLVKQSRAGIGCPSLPCSKAT